VSPIEVRSRLCPHDNVTVRAWPSSVPGLVVHHSGPAYATTAACACCIPADGWAIAHAGSGAMVGMAADPETAMAGIDRIIAPLGIDWTRTLSALTLGISPEQLEALSLVRGAATPASASIVRRMVAEEEA